MNYRRTIGREGGGTAGQTEKTWVGGAPEKPNLFLLGDYIKPYTLTPFANVNHFVVGYAGADGKPIALRFRVDITVKEMAFHATWLTQSVGERMQELLDLDL
ncbi:hypothetical protein [Pseudomonas thivervalensis]|uniref:hypothetical protein n=1 Tax=Pseudomonas thivervalensis TaxID=86265 RepID=UPI003CFA8B2E